MLANSHFQIKNFNTYHRKNFLFQLDDHCTAVNIEFKKVTKKHTYM